MPDPNDNDKQAAKAQAINLATEVIKQAKQLNKDPSIDWDTMFATYVAKFETAILEEIALAGTERPNIPVDPLDKLIPAYGRQLSNMGMREVQMNKFEDKLVLLIPINHAERLLQLLHRLGETQN